jgi:rare lipoprotein A
MRYRRLPRIATLVAIAALLGPAASAWASDTGGASPTAGPTAPVTPGGLRGGMVRWHASLPTGGTAVRVERLDPVAGTWSPLAHVQAAADGSFDATWLGDALGSYTVRAVPDDGHQQQASAADAPLIANVTVYRSAKATWYGPGFYGKKTACGSRMSRGLVGVAHRRLPCGTPVEVFYKGRSLVVPVVDRGPFANGAAYDLTAAAAQALGMTATDRIGVAPRVAGVIARTSR